MKSARVVLVGRSGEEVRKAHAGHVIPDSREHLLCEREYPYYSTVLYHKLCHDYTLITV